MLLRPPRRCGIGSPLATIAPAASTRAAVSAPSTRLPVLVQRGHDPGSRAVLAGSAGFGSPANAVTTAHPREDTSTPILASLSSWNGSRTLVGAPAESPPGGCFRSNREVWRGGEHRCEASAICRSSTEPIAGRDGRLSSIGAGPRLASALPLSAECRSRAGRSAGQARSRPARPRGGVQRAMRLARRSRGSRRRPAALRRSEHGGDELGRRRQRAHSGAVLRASSTPPTPRRRSDSSAGRRRRHCRPPRGSTSRPPRRLLTKFRRPTVSIDLTGSVRASKMGVAMCGRLWMVVG
jgi:hypothetical protein